MRRRAVEFFIYRDDDFIQRQSFFIHFVSVKHFVDAGFAFGTVFVGEAGQQGFVFFLLLAIAVAELAVQHFGDFRRDSVSHSDLAGEKRVRQDRSGFDERAGGRSDGGSVSALLGGKKDSRQNDENRQ